MLLLTLMGLNYLLLLERNCYARLRLFLTITVVGCASLTLKLCLPVTAPLATKNARQTRLLNLNVAVLPIPRRRRPAHHIVVHARVLPTQMTRLLPHEGVVAEGQHLRLLLPSMVLVFRAQPWLLALTATQRYHKVVTMPIRNSHTAM